jgi:acetate kinase
MSEDEVNNLLNKHSGLFGLSGLMDMREILVTAGYKVPGFTAKIKANKRDKEMASLTIDIFIYNIKKYIGAYSMILQKTDALIFTAGIGERSQLIRNLITANLGNFKILVIPTNEELMIASLIKKLL